jgi:hypothetical protein
MHSDKVSPLSKARAGLPRPRGVNICVSTTAKRYGMIVDLKRRPTKTRMERIQAVDSEMAL